MALKQYIERKERKCMREIALQTPRKMEDIFQTLEQRVSPESLKVFYAEDHSEASCPSAAHGGSSAGAGDCPNEPMTHRKSGLAQSWQ